MTAEEACHDGRVIPYLTIVLAVCSLFATAYMNFVRPGRKRRREVARREQAAGKPKPVTTTTPKAPLDLSRTYPRPERSRSKLNRICPVCGTGAETGLTGRLDGHVLGWPAHKSCAEWLGDWKPARSFRIPSAAALQAASQAAIPVPAQQDFQRYRCECGIEFQGAPADVSRSREVHFSSGQHAQALKAREPAKPVIREWCTCGQVFNGTAQEVARARDLHQRSGECPQAVNFRV